MRQHGFKAGDRVVLRAGQYSSALESGKVYVVDPQTRPTDHVFLEGVFGPCGERGSGVNGEWSFSARQLDYAPPQPAEVMQNLKVEGPSNAPTITVGYPDGNPKSIEGAKKTQLQLVPPPAIEEMGKVMQLGAKKYGAYNWRKNSVAASVYQGAALRHLMQWYEGEDIDSESGASHLGHAMSCLAILLDAKAKGNLIDDRPCHIKKES